MSNETPVFDLPPVWTVRMYKVYKKAGYDYVQSLPKGEPSIALVEKVAGALALIKAQFVRVSGGPLFMAALEAAMNKLDTLDDQPDGVLGALYINVALPMEQSVDVPFLG